MGVRVIFDLAESEAQDIIWLLEQARQHARPGGWLYGSGRLEALKQVINEKKRHVALVRLANEVSWPSFSSEEKRWEFSSLEAAAAFVSQQDRVEYVRVVSSLERYGKCEGEEHEWELDLVTVKL
jgi:hypothetical protein